MRRGRTRIERHALGLPGSNRRMEIDPAVTRDGDRIVRDGEEVDRSYGPIHGLAMDLGTTTIVLRLIDLETSELIAGPAGESVGEADWRDASGFLPKTPAALPAILGGFKTNTGSPSRDRQGAEAKGVFPASC